MTKKKTKKDKVIAEYRKRARLLETQKRREASLEKLVFVEDKTSVNRVQKERSALPVKKSYTLSASEKDSLVRQARLISGDLRKTVILSVIGVGIIIVLYVV